MKQLDDPTSNQLGPSVKEAPATSANAALGNLPRSGSQRRRVLDAIVKAGDRGHTRDELVSYLGLPDSSVDPRVWELIKMGWVEATGKTRKTQTGSDAEVLALTWAGCLGYANLIQEERLGNRRGKQDHSVPLGCQ